MKTQAESFPSAFCSVVDGASEVALEFPVDGESGGPFWNEDGGLDVERCKDWDQEEVGIVSLSGNRYRPAERLMGLFSRLGLYWGDEFTAHDELARAGADFAVTQLFFRPEDYFGLVERVAARGVELPILPGIMPITNLGSLRRMAELSGATIPPAVLARFDGLTEPADVRRVGVEVATELCEALLAGGAPGLHFYTLNRSRATLEIFEALRITA